MEKVNISLLDESQYERIENVRQQWIEKSGGDLGAINYEAVCEILLLLVENGVPPTVRAIREVYGSGSPNVITPLMRLAYTRMEVHNRLALRSKGNDVPPRLLQFWDLVVADATAEAKLSVNEEMRVIENAQAELKAEAERIRNLEHVFVERNSHLESAKQMLEISARELRSSLDERTRALSVSEEQRKADKESLSHAKSEIEALRLEIAKATGALNVERERHAATSERARTNELSARKYEEALKQTSDQLSQLTERHNALLVEKAQIAIEMSEVKSKLSIQSDLAAKLLSAEAQIESLREQLKEANDARQTLQNDLLNAKSNLAVAQSHAEIINVLESEWEKTKEQLRDAIRAKDLAIRNPPALITRLESLENAITRLINKYDS